MFNYRILSKLSTRNITIDIRGKTIIPILCSNDGKVFNINKRIRFLSGISENKCIFYENGEYDYERGYNNRI